MALQDLTPQLRTRLSRIERLVGLFIALALVLLLAGFFYYLYQTAERRGWFRSKVAYWTMVEDATGLKEGDTVKLMGFTVGEIVEIEAMPATSETPRNVYVRFLIQEPYYGYIWRDSKVKIAPADFLGNRFLEVSKGTVGPPTVLETNRTSFGRSRTEPVGFWDDESDPDNPRYLPLDQMKAYYLPPRESPGLNDRLDRLVTQVERALPSILGLTNSIQEVLEGASGLTQRLEERVEEIRPLLESLAQIAANLEEPDGSLGHWLLGTSMQADIRNTLRSAQDLLGETEGHLETLIGKLNLSLNEVAQITKSLREQVEGNPQILASISEAVVHADELVQGLKRHWLLRSAFREKSSRPPPRPQPPKRGKR